MRGAELRVDKSNVATVVAMARQAVSAGNFSLAEGLCQKILVHDADNGPALTTLAQIYERLELWPQAISAARRALVSQPDDPILTAILNTPREPAVGLSSTPRFLVIKAWGHGLLSDVAHVLGACLLAEITGRTPVTDWGTNSRYSDGSADDAYRFYFEPISPLVIGDVARHAAGGVFPWYWTPANLETSPGAGGPRRPRALELVGRSEAIVVCEVYVSVLELLPHLPDVHPMFGQSLTTIYRYLADRYLKVRSDIDAQGQAFFEANLSAGPSVAVHLRGSDKHWEYDIAPVNAALLDVAGALDETWRIFVMSDDERLVRQCQERFGARAVLTPSRRTELDVGLHLQGLDGLSLGRDMVLDCSIALKCDMFLGSGASNVAAVIEVMKDWPTDTCHLHDASVLHERSLILYKLR